MNLYGSSVNRKPPLPSTNTTSYSPNNYQDTQTNYVPQAISTETVILHIIPNENNTLSQIACIVLSTDCHERESFSFNFDIDDNSFETQADYIYNTLTDRKWLVLDTYDVNMILMNSFKAINKTFPIGDPMINLSQIFKQWQVNLNQINSVSAANNARIGMLISHIISQQTVYHYILVQLNPT